jgi:hypothetical protein
MPDIPLNDTVRFSCGSAASCALVSVTVLAPSMTSTGPLAGAAVSVTGAVATPTVTDVIRCAKRTVVLSPGTTSSGPPAVGFPPEVSASSAGWLP